MGGEVNPVRPDRGSSFDSTSAEQLRRASREEPPTAGADECERPPGRLRTSSRTNCQAPKAVLAFRAGSIPRTHSDRAAAPGPRRPVRRYDATPRPECGPLLPSYSDDQAPSIRRTATSSPTWYALWSATSSASRSSVWPSPCAKGASRSFDLSATRSCIAARSERKALMLLSQAAAPGGASASGQ